MKDFTQLSPEELNQMDKHVLITIIGSLQAQLNAISSQLNFLTEQIALMNQRSFGRKTEQLDQMHQLNLFEVFNEPEVFCDNSKEPEITEITVSSYSRKKKTTREQNLEGLPARIFDHTLSSDELKELFPDGYKELPCEIYKRLSIIPQTFLVDEHHVHVYASKNNDGTIIKAERPADVFRNSIATPSLVSSIITSKYANHLPLERQSSCFKDNGIKLETNTLANWMMKASELHLSIIYDELHKHLYDSNVIHADETPFEVIRDGRKAGANSYMWVYRNGVCDAKHPVVIYDYQQTRCTDHPATFLNGYSGILVTDGYQVYHSLDKQRDDLQVAGCWIHAKRKFAELVKAVGINTVENTIAAEATKRISELFHLDNKFDDLNKTEREKQRQLILKPKVDDFFAWAKASTLKVPASSATAKGLNYCINQEQFLRVFLSNGDVPMDNNRAEQAIRPFTLGRKNWVNMDSIRGAQASAILYSLVETAKANNLRIYGYLEYLLTELPAHADDTGREFLEDLLPWSEAAQEKCRKIQKS
jgi:transposase